MHRAAAASTTPYQAYTGQLVAGVNDQENRGIEATNQLQPTTSGYLGQASGLAQAATGAVDPSDLGVAQIQKYMDPYRQSVIDSTLASINNQNRQQAQGLTSGLISSGAFGGDRAGVAQAALAGQQDLAKNATIAGLNSSNYQQALATAQQQQGLGLSAAQANRAALGTGAELMTGLGQAASSTGIANANAQLQGGLLQQQTEQAKNSADYGQFLQKQAFPYQQSQFLTGSIGSLAPALGGSSTGTQVQSPANPLNSIIGGGLGLGALLLERGGRVVDMEAERRARGGRTLADEREFQGLGQVRRFADGGFAGMPYAGSDGYVPTVGFVPTHAPTSATPQGTSASPGSTDGGLNLSAGAKLFSNSSAGDRVSDFVQDLHFANGGKVLDLGSARMRRGYDGGGVVTDPNAMLFDPNAFGGLGTMERGVGLGAAGLLPTMEPPAPKAPQAPLPSDSPTGLAQADMSRKPVPVAPAPNVTPVLGYRGQDGSPAPAPQGVLAADTSGASADANGGLGAINRAAAPSGTVGSNFDRSMDRTFGFEGGLNPQDTNGTPSNFGINQAAHPTIDVTKLSKDEARAMYKREYWDGIGADKLPPALAHVAFDTSVIAGPGKALELIKESGGDPSKFMDLRTNYLNGLISTNPEKYGPYAKSWANRDASLRADIGAGGLPATASAYAGGTGRPDSTSSPAAGVLAADTSGRVGLLEKMGLGGILPKLTDDQRTALMAAGFGMAASGSRSVGQAFGEGGLKGIGALQTAQKLGTERGLAQAQIVNLQSEAADRPLARAQNEERIGVLTKELHGHIERIAIDRANQQSEDEYRKGEIANQKAKIQAERYTMIPGPDGSFRYFDKQNPQAGLLTAEQIPGGVPGSTATQPSGGAAVPARPQASGSTSPVQLDSSSFTKTGNPTLRAPQNYLPTNYYQNQLRAQTDPVVRETLAKQTVEDVAEANKRATKAYSGLFYSDEMDKAASALPQTGVLAPGGFFNERLNIAKNWNAFAGAIPALGDLQVNPEAVAKGESLIKDKTRLAADLTQSLGSREAAAVYSSMMSAVPGGDNTRAGYKAVSSAIRTLSQREVDHNSFLQDWSSRYGNSNGAEVAFNQLNPPMLYARQAEALARIPQQATDLLRANAGDPKTISAFEAKYGAGTARYYTGQLGR